MSKYRILNLRSFMRTSQVRWNSKLATQPKDEANAKMLAWQIHSYGGLEELQLMNVRIPVISKPTDVLVKVEAASVNPIDIAMSRGYGATALNYIRRAKKVIDSVNHDAELPLTLGRDFSGIVASKGHGINDDLKVGDEVWGVIPVHEQGCHADYVLIDKSMIRHRPQNLSHIEAASILYAGLTAWSALWITGGLSYNMLIPSKKSMPNLILGGSGGVGTLAIQLLKAWGMHVVATCSTDAVEMVQDLGADIVIDYKSEEADKEIMMEGPFNIILDCANQGPATVLSKGYTFDSYISLNSPALKNIDDQGLLGGMFRNLQELLKYNIPTGKRKGLVKWAYFTPCESGIETLQDFVSAGKIKPVIHKVFKFKDLPSAYQCLADGHSRGKIVIDMK